MSMFQRARRMAEHRLRRSADVELNLIPLIDIMSVMVAFLLVYLVGYFNLDTAAAATQNAVCIEVEGTQLADDYCFVKLTSTGAGTVNAITRDLGVMRAADNLPATGV